MVGRYDGMFNVWDNHNKAVLFTDVPRLFPDVPALINIPDSIHYVFILADELHLAILNYT